MRNAIICTLAVVSAAILGIVAPGGEALAASQLQNCKPHKNCKSSGKPCQAVARAGQTVILRGSAAANAPLIGKSAIRVQLCSGANDVCTGGDANQSAQVIATNNGNVVYQLNLDSKNTTDTGGSTSIPAHTQFAVRCYVQSGGFCRFAWQHCLRQLPLVAPSTGAKQKLKPGLKTN